MSTHMTFRKWRISRIMVPLVAVAVLVAPAAAQLHPHHSFMANGSWQFRNFGTPRMDGDSFMAAFDLHWYDYLNPITPIMYLAARDMADGGNCFGMCLLAAEGERSRGTLSVEFSGTLREDFWSNYPANTPTLTHDINTYHWRQLSSEFVTRWLVGLVESAQRNAERAQADIAAGRYGVWCINMDGRGHALIPLAVTSTSENIDVVLYDPNLPLDETHANTMVINRATGNWRYHMAWNPIAGWNGTWTGGATGVSYVSYDGGRGWRDLINDPLELIIGNDTTVEQITDNDGRRLYAHVPARGLEDVDFSARGLGRDVVPWVPLMQRRDVRPRRIPSQAVRAQATQSGQLNQALLNRYEPDYGATNEIYFVRNQNLTLHVDLKARGQKQRLTMAMGNRNGTMEVAVEAEQAGAAAPRLTIPVRDPNSGVTMTSRSSVPLKAMVRVSTLDQKQQQVLMETAAGIPIRANAQTVVRRGQQLQIQAPEQQAIQVQREAAGKDGQIRQLGTSATQLGPQPEPPDNARKVIRPRARR